MTWLIDNCLDPSHAFAREYAPPLSKDTADLALLSRIGLTHREAEIVMRIVADRSRTNGSRKQLACDLGISASTLRVHMNRIRAKLAVNKRGDIALLETVALLSSRSRETEHFGGSSRH
jgi:DNA-binding CsgD family transcriptional regulator